MSSEGNCQAQSMSLSDEAGRNKVLQGEVWRQMMGMATDQASSSMFTYLIITKSCACHIVIHVSSHVICRPLPEPIRSH